MYFDRFDVCEAAYVYAMYWHSGQWSPEYAVFGRLSRLHFKPGLCLGSTDRRYGLSENGRAILARWLRKCRDSQRTTGKWPSIFRTV